MESLAALDSGDVSPVVDRTYPLAEVPDAIQHLTSGDVRGKVVIDADRAR